MSDPYFETDQDLREKSLKKRVKELEAEVKRLETTQSDLIRNCGDWADRALAAEQALEQHKMRINE